VSDLVTSIAPGKKANILSENSQAAIVKTILVRGREKK